MCCLSLAGHRAFLQQPQKLILGVTTVGNQSSVPLGILRETSGNTPQNCATRDRGGRTLILGVDPLGWRLFPRANPFSHWKTKQVLLLLENNTCRQSSRQSRCGVQLLLASWGNCPPSLQAAQKQVKGLQAKQQLQQLHWISRICGHVYEYATLLPHNPFTSMTWLAKWPGCFCTHLSLALSTHNVFLPPAHMSPPESPPPTTPDSVAAETHSGSIHITVYMMLTTPEPLHVILLYENWCVYRDVSES